MSVAAVLTNAIDLSIFICKLSFEQALAHWVCMTSWSAVAGQLTMPGLSINDKSGLALGLSTNTKQTEITLGPRSRLPIHPCGFEEVLCFWGTWAQIVMSHLYLGNSANTDLIRLAKVIPALETNHQTLGPCYFKYIWGTLAQVANAWMAVFEAYHGLYVLPGKITNKSPEFNHIPTGCCLLIFIYELIPPSAGRNRV